ncbi:MAG: hypothetical protein ACOX3T_00460 [Bdellovibrionota bacterium]
MKKSIFLLTLFTTTQFLISCTLSKDKAYDSLVSKLKNRGMIALSSENPYIAPNLLIAKEIDANKELKGFIDHRGLPNVIQVNKEYFRPIKYRFYYALERAFYNLELVNNTWVINGPIPINQLEANQIYYLTGGNFKAPQILLSSELLSNKENLNNQNDNIITLNNDITNSASSANDNIKNNITQKSPSITSPSSKLPKKSEPKSLPKQNVKQGYQGAIKSDVAKGQSSATKNARGDSLSREAVSRENVILDDIIKKTSTYSAELNYQGDLIHYVTYRGENLSLISLWYTKDQSNADKIARINSKRSQEALNIGDKIIIPSYLLKNKNKLTQKALQDITSAFSSSSNNETLNNQNKATISSPQNYQENTKGNININNEIEFF